MTATDITPRQAIEHLEQGWKLAPGELSGTLGASSKTIDRWRTGATHPQNETRRRLAELIELDQRLQETFDSRDAIRTWLHANNRYLGGLTPIEVARVGRLDRVEAAIEALDSGVVV